MLADNPWATPPRLQIRHNEHVHTPLFDDLSYPLEPLIY